MGGVALSVCDTLIRISVQGQKRLKTKIWIHHNDQKRIANGQDKVRSYP